MCRWGCPLSDSTYMCKWCGTRYCRECLLGDFAGKMSEPNICRVCNQRYCQGRRVEYFPPPTSLMEASASTGARGVLRPETAPAVSNRAATKSAKPTAPKSAAGGGRSRKSTGKRRAKRSRTKTA